MSRRRWSGSPATAKRFRALRRFACHLFLMSPSMCEPFLMIADHVPVRDAAMADRGHVADIGAAAAAEHPERGQDCHQCAVVAGKFGRVARVEVGGFVQFRVALARGIGADHTDPAPPRAVKGAAEVVGMGAVHAKPGHAAARGRLRLDDRLAEGLARDEPPIGLDREGHDHRHTGADRGPRGSE